MSDVDWLGHSSRFGMIGFIKPTARGPIDPNDGPMEYRVPGTDLWTDDARVADLDADDVRRFVAGVPDADAAAIVAALLDATEVD